MWFGGTSALAGLTFWYLQHQADRGHEAGAGVAVFFLAAIAMVIKGQASRPLRILGYDSDDRTIKLKILQRRGRTVRSCSSARTTRASITWCANR